MKPLLALALTAVLVLAGCSDVEPARQRPVPTPSTAPSTVPPLDLAGIVDDPDARIVGVTVRRGDPSVRGIVWSLCRTPRCFRADQVIAVTDDGFATRHLRALPQQTVETPLDGVFLLTNRRGGEILQPDGTRTIVEWQAGPPGPLKRSEHAVGHHRFGRVHAVDPATGAGHLVPMPRAFHGLHRDPSGALRTFVEAPGEHGWFRMLSSYDGGRTWDERATFDVPRDQLAEAIDSSTTTAAVVTGGDGATLLPVGGLHVNDGSGWRSFPGPDDPPAHLGEGGGAVLPNGRLLLSLVGTGLWVSDGRDWSDLRPVPMGAPFDTLDLRREDPPILDIVAAPGRVTVYASTASPDTTLWSSTDAGHTWTEVTAR